MVRVQTINRASGPGCRFDYRPVELLPKSAEFGGPSLGKRNHQRNLARGNGGKLPEVSCHGLLDLAARVATVVNPEGHNQPRGLNCGRQVCRIGLRKPRQSWWDAPRSRDGQTQRPNKQFG